jgi:hypothetical protein
MDPHQDIPQPAKRSPAHRSRVAKASLPICPDKREITAFCHLARKQAEPSSPSRRKGTIQHAAQPVAKHAVKIDIERGFATRRHRLQPLAFGAQHRCTAHELALPFAQMGSAAKIAADIFKEIAEPSRRGRPAIG